ncbi:LRR receptor-like serine/threonine-protein kinase ERECTA [Camellia lanceoleosa]|nr:LRR receptor-like serine/threonine-protein kinase ERECTA [Camellia lanceoleosa]
MDRCPRKRPRLGWDVAPQALQAKNAIVSQEQDTIITKAPKKPSLVLRMIVLTFAMLCGLYICSICLKQISTRTNFGLLNVQVIQRPCEPPIIETWEKLYVHYPQPKTFSRDECKCNPVRYFAILSTQRSGSGWFETLLNSHINISSNREIFSVKVRRSNISTIVETLDKIYNLDWLTSASKNECTAVVGLKWMLNQITFGQSDLSFNELYGDIPFSVSKLKQLEHLILKNN